MCSVTPRKIKIVTLLLFGVVAKNSFYQPLNVRWKYGYILELGLPDSQQTLDLTLVGFPDPQQISHLTSRWEIDREFDF